MANVTRGTGIVERKKKKKIPLKRELFEAYFCNGNEARGNGYSLKVIKKRIEQKKHFCFFSYARGKLEKKITKRRN